MQRAVLALWTMPNSSFVMASAGTDFRADRILAVHADLNRGLRRQKPIHVIHMDHRGLPVGFALGAGHLAGVTSDATLRVEEELLVRAKRGGVHALA
jgi:hypothetical protein